MILRVKTPPTYPNERKYILSVLLGDFLGFELTFEHHQSREVAISADDQRWLRVADGLFAFPETDWLTAASLPKRPLQSLRPADAGLNWRGEFEAVPVLYGDNSAPPLNVSPTELRLGLDLFGSAFFLLTCLEELVRPERDQHDRFPVNASLLFQEGLLERPLVNEYLELLWTALRHLWPSLERKPRAYRFLVSHDVDKPLASKRLFSTLRGIGHDLIREQRLDLVGRRIGAYVDAKRRRFERDPYNTFDWLLEQSEVNGHKSAFYFICDHTAGAVDGDYTLDDPWIQDLMKKVHVRGHEIGLHPSYNSYHQPEQIKREFEIIKASCEHLGIEQTAWGGRQHYLRWANPETWQAWEDAGLTYDSTLGFAGHAGFRTGCCYEYRVFNLKTREALNLLERPLIVMEQTLFNAHYMALETEAAWETVGRLQARCKRYGGDFTLLWHNSNLTTAKDREFYRRALEAF